jgi:hypothetical protein
MLAARDGHIRAVSLLLMHGALPDLVDKVSVRTGYCKVAPVSRKSHARVVSSTVKPHSCLLAAPDISK